MTYLHDPLTDSKLIRILSIGTKLVLILSDLGSIIFRKANLHVLACSIASAMEYMQEGIVAKCILSYYKTFENDKTKKAFSMNDVLAVTMYNKVEKKMKSD